MKKIFLLSIMSLFILCSCSSSQSFTNASIGNLKSYTEKDTYKGENTENHYLTLYISNGTVEQYDLPQDKKMYIGINYHKSYVQKNFNFYYGGGLTYGRYNFKSNFKDIVKTNDSKSFCNLNLKTGANVKLSTKSSEFKIIGLELTYHNEFGEYPNFLEFAQMNYPDSDITNHKNLIGLNFYSEYTLKVNTNNHFTIGGFSGKLIFQNQLIPKYFEGMYFGYTHKKYTLHLTMQKDYVRQYSSTFGITYKL